MNIKTKLHYPTFYRRIMRFANWSGTAILAFCFDLSLLEIKTIFFSKKLCVFLRFMRGWAHGFAKKKSRGKPCLFCFLVLTGLFPILGMFVSGKNRGAFSPILGKDGSRYTSRILYLYYCDGSHPVNLSRVAKDLSVSKTTCTRAFDDHLAFSLINQKKEGVNKWIPPAFSKDEYLKRGYPKMKFSVHCMLFINPGNHFPINSLRGSGFIGKN